MRTQHHPVGGVSTPAGGDGPPPWGVSRLSARRVRGMRPVCEQEARDLLDLVSPPPRGHPRSHRADNTPLPTNSAPMEPNPQRLSGAHGGLNVTVARLRYGTDCIRSSCARPAACRRGHTLATLRRRLPLTHVTCCWAFSQLDGCLRPRPAPPWTCGSCSR
jgi:hypothetical protein